MLISRITARPVAQPPRRLPGANRTATAPAQDAPALPAVGISRRALLQALALAGVGVATGVGFSPSASARASEAVEPVCWPCPSIVGAWPQDPTPADDFYAWVNLDWARTATLPEGYPAYSVGDECQDRVLFDLIGLLRNPGPSHIEQLAAALFAEGLDWQARDAVGLDPVRPFVDAVLGAQTCEELAATIASSPITGCYSNLVMHGVGPDSHDPSVNRMFVSAPTLTLGDAAEYAAITEYGLHTRDAFRDYRRALLEHYGLDAAESTERADAAFELETLLAGDICTLAEVYADGYAERAYNPMTLEELEALYPNFPFVGILQAVGAGNPEYIVVEQPRALAALEAAYTPQNLELFKSHLACDVLAAVARYADTASVAARNAFYEACYGIAGTLPDEQLVFNAVNADPFACELISRVYAERFASEDACRDVRAMVDEIAAAFQRRIASRTWLSEQTRAHAAEKLAAIGVQVGGAQRYSVDWDAVEFAEGAGFLQHAIDACTLGVSARCAMADKPTSPDELLGQTAHVVNAFNSLSHNAIAITAAIMQPPFYDPAASRAANLGGLGAIIGHELTHAFDNQGAQHDKDGAVANWWTDEDYAAFSERAGAVAELFGSIEPLEGMVQHGELVASEAVADLGGFACCLDILLQEGASDDELREFFESFSISWRDLLAPEYLAYLLVNDPHPASYLRVDLTVQQFDEFYRLYGVTEGDRMYRAPADRLEVW